MIFWDFFFYRLCCPTNFCLLSINLLKSIKIKTKHHFNWFIIYLDRAKGFVCLVSLHLALILLSCPHSSDCEFIKSQSEIMKTGPYLVSISECFCTTSLHLEKWGPHLVPLEMLVLFAHCGARSSASSQCSTSLLLLQGMGLNKLALAEINKPANAGQSCIISRICQINPADIVQQNCTHAELGLDDCELCLPLQISLWVCVWPCLHKTVRL